ncbi:MAG: Lrp/AsnC family transcriptional regulator [Clostridia bacterium]|nr:Lrp/AsnC family transcriptional regulator [Clostridia bacterium]
MEAWVTCIERKGCDLVTKLEGQLLDLMQEDCRLPLEKLAVMCSSTVDEVAQAISDLEERHIILRYQPTINWDLAERERVEAMIEVRVMPQRDMGFDAVAKRIYRFEEVKSVYLMSGSYDLLVLVEARTLKELALFVSQKLSTLEMVTGTATSFVLKRYKEDGVIFEEEKPDQRLVVSP